MTARERVIDKVRKLLAHAASTTELGSIEEAAVFTAKANELLLRHRLELSDLELQAELTADPVEHEDYDPIAAAGIKRGGNRRAWLEILVHGVAEANLCEVLVIPGSKTVVLIGARQDVALTKYLLAILVRSAERLAILHERKVRLAAIRAGLTVPRKPKVAFLTGFSVEVTKRLRALRTEVVTTASATALVRLDQAAAAVTAYIQRSDLSDGKAGRINAKVTDRTSFEAGQQAGREQALTSGIGSSSRQPGQVGAGQRALPRGGAQ